MQIGTASTDLIISARALPRLRVRYETLALLMLVLALRISVDLSYIFIVQPFFSYAGYTLTIDPGVIALSYAILMGMILVVPRRKSLPSTSVCFVFLVIGYVPFTSVFALMPGDPRYFTLFTISFLIFYATISYFPLMRLPKGVKYPFLILSGITAACVLYVCVTFVLNGGLAYVNFDITKVYSVRWDLNEKVLTGLTSYCVEWCTKVFIPALLVYGLWKKKRTIVIGTVALTLIFFVITSAKSALAFPILVLVTYFGEKMDRFRIGFVLAALAVPVLASLTYFYFNSMLVGSVLLDRIFFVPSIANMQYYEFFQTHPLVYWSNIFMSHFYSYSYHDLIPLVVGRTYSPGGADLFLNVGIFATGYMQFGIAGMVIFPFIAALTLKVTDSLVVGRMPVYVGLSISIVAAVGYLSGDLTETILSHGILISWLTLYLLGSADGRDLVARSTPKHVEHEVGTT